jgi:hypothetical protein
MPFFFSRATSSPCFGSRASILARPLRVTKFGCGLIGRSGSAPGASESESRTKALLMATH